MYASPMRRPQGHMPRPVPSVRYMPRVQIVAPSQPATPVQQPVTFFPPLAIQQSICDSISNGDFIDAKIFAFSRRSRERGRVDTPKALFVNTHVLANACSYFRSSVSSLFFGDPSFTILTAFDLSDGVETSLTEELPLGVSTGFDLEEHNPDDDYDPAEGGPADTQVPREVPAQILPERTIKAYVIKYTAYRTLRAIVWYIYSGEITFSPDSSPESLSASVKSIYRFADEHGMDDLRKLAVEEISASVNKLEASKLMEEAFSVFVSRYPELHDLYVRRLRSVLSSTNKSSDAFRQRISRYFSGELSHSKDFLASALRTLMSGSTGGSPNGVDGNHNTIPRVFLPWPVRTREVLRTSLDNGVFEDIRVMLPSCPESTKYMVHFAGAVDEGFGSSITRFCQLEPTSRHDTEISLSTWQAIAYYMYAGCISFKPLGPQGTELIPDHSPSDMLFRGHLCSAREVVYLAGKLAACDALTVLATNEIVSKMTPDNVVEETFCDPPPPKKVIDKGVEIIRENRRNAHIHSQLQRVLEEGTSGGSSTNAAAFSACLITLFQTPLFD